MSENIRIDLLRVSDTLYFNLLKNNILLGNTLIRTSTFSMRLILLLMFCQLPALALGQELNLRVGIYNSFYNFVNDRPLPARIQVRWRTDDPMYPNEVKVEKDGRRYVPSDRVSFLPGIKVKRRAYAKRNMWGFYDGENVYISSKTYAQSNVIRYSRILHFGRYCYFYGAEDVYKKTAGLIGGLTGTLPIGHYYLLDMTNGEVIKLNKETVASIVAEYPTLHSRFQNSKKSVRELCEFIEQYNQMVEK